MLRVYKQSWSGDVTMFLDFHWENGNMKGAKKTKMKLSCSHTLKSHLWYLTDNEFKRNARIREAKSC